MRSPVDFVNLQVDNITPDRYSTGVNIYTSIQVSFNSELNINSIFGNIMLLEDRDRNYTNQNDIDFNLYTKVECQVTYNDKKVILSPISQLCSTSRYIVYIPKNSILDFKGRSLSENFISFFDTDIPGILPPCNVVYPKNNSIIQSLDRVEIEDIQSDMYLIQISTNKDFNIGVYENVVSHTNITDNFNIKDGSYYIRARSTNGEYGDVSFFTIKSHEDAMVLETDYETFSFEQIDDNTLNHTSSFPEHNVNVSVKSNLVYMKFDKIIDINDIDFYESGLFDKHITDDDYSLDPLDGTFITINDYSNKCTYVSFVMDNI